MTDQLADYSSGSVTVSINGKDYPLCQLGPGDYMAAQNHIRGHRLSQLFAAWREVPIPSEDRGVAIAKVTCNIVNRAEMLVDDECRHFLIWRSLKRGGFKGTWPEFRDNADPVAVVELDNILNHICRLSEELDGEARPTTGIGSSSTPGNDGASTSATSATNTG
jgi:hypothetical protein